MAAVAGFFFVLWRVGKTIARLKRERRGGLITLTMLGAGAGVIVVGVAAAMFFLATHDDGGAPTGQDYLAIFVAFYGPIGAACLALLVWVCMLVGADGPEEK